MNTYCPLCAATETKAISALLKASADADAFRLALWQSVKAEANDLRAAFWRTGKLPHALPKGGVLAGLRGQLTVVTTCKAGRHDLLKRAATRLFDEGMLDALVLSNRGHQAAITAGQYARLADALQGWTCNGQREADEAVCRLEADFIAATKPQPLTFHGTASNVQSVRRTAYFGSLGRAKKFAKAKAKGQLQPTIVSWAGSKGIKVDYTTFIPAWEPATLSCTGVDSHDYQPQAGIWVADAGPDFNTDYTDASDAIAQVRDAFAEHLAAGGSDWLTLHG